MRTVLHIKSDTTDPRAESVINRHLQQESLVVVVMDLNTERPDYEALLDRIFEADSVAVW